MISVLERVIGGENDKICRIKNGGISRPLTIGSSWTELRIGVRVCIDLGSYTGTLPSYPEFNFGVCANAGYEIWTNSIVTHFCGMRAYNVTWTPSLSGSDYIVGLGTGGFAGTTKYGSTVTSGVTSPSATSSIAASVGNVRCALFMQIQKSGTSYPFQICYPQSGAGAAVDIGESDLLLGLEAGDVSAIPSLTPFGSYQAYSNNLTVDEATNGTFDGVFVSWNRSTWSAEVSDLAVYKVS